MLRQTELAEGFTETFYLEGVVLIDFIKKINIVKIKRKLFGVMNRKKIIDVNMEVVNDIL